MAATPALAASATEAQAVAYLEKHFGGYKYHDSKKTPYEGMDAAQIYAYIAKQHPGAKPYDIAAATADLLASSALGNVVGGSVTAAGNAVGDIATGVATANYAPWTTGLTGLLGDLTSKGTWLRVAKVVVGSVMIIVGVAKITGAGKAVTAAKGALL